MSCILKRMVNLIGIIAAMKYRNTAGLFMPRACTSHDDILQAGVCIVGACGSATRYLLV